MSTETTATVDYASEIVRKRWMSEGLLQSASNSFWSAYTGNSKDSIVYQINNENASAGHTVVFDYEGNLAGKAVRGKDTAAGKGEDKKMFSDKITVDRYRWVAYNGDAFDGVNIGNLSITQHSDSRSKLGDLFIRAKDQALFDAAQGNLITNEDGMQAPSHIIDLGNQFSFNTLIDIEIALKTSTGFTTGGIRRPLEPFMINSNMDGAKQVYIFVVDHHMAGILRKDSDFQSIIQHGDIRGNNNRNIKGVVGRMGCLLVVEADHFFGETPNTTQGWGIESSSVERQGLRQYHGSAGNEIWTGQDGFDYNSSDLHSRGLILGKGAMQLAFGKMPDYRFAYSSDFNIDSESCLEVWMEARKTHLKNENAQYKQAKVSNLDYGVIAVDLQVV